MKEIKIEWEKFDEKQTSQISKGRAMGLDVSWYARRRI